MSTLRRGRPVWRPRRVSFLTFFGVLNLMRYTSHLSRERASPLIIRP